MSRHDILIFLCGSLAGTVALLAVRAVRSFGRREIEDELLAALIELRRQVNADFEFFRAVRADTTVLKAMIERADLAIALARAETQS